MDGRKGLRHPGYFLDIPFIMQLAVIYCHSGEDLKVGFYSKISPNVEVIIMSTIIFALIIDRTMAAIMLRIDYNDYFVKV